TQPLVGTLGIWFTENGESLLNSADATFDFTANTATPVIITASDTDGVAALTVIPGGAAALQLGADAGTTLDITAGGAMTIGDATATDSLQLATAGALTLGTNAADSVAIAATGALTLGGATSTTVR
ncbi:unnamed protein product, partial [marine sediment metagenome]